jgi:hypothetical protein
MSYEVPQQRGLRYLANSSNAAPIGIYIHATVAYALFEMGLEKVEPLAAILNPYLVSLEAAR